MERSKAERRRFDAADTRLKVSVTDPQIQPHQSLEGGRTETEGTQEEEEEEEEEDFLCFYCLSIISAAN